MLRVRRHRARRIAAGGVVAIVGVLAGSCSVAESAPYGGGINAYAGTISYAPGQGLDILSVCNPTSWTLSAQAAGIEALIASNEYVGPATFTVQGAFDCGAFGVSSPPVTMSLNGTGPLGTLSCNQNGTSIFAGTIYELSFSGQCSLNGTVATVAILIQGTLVPTATDPVSGGVGQGVVAGSIDVRGSTCPLNCTCVPEQCLPVPVPTVVTSLLTPTFNPSPLAASGRNPALVR
jgi:hypothetical protein